MATDWRTVVRIGLIYLVSAGKIKEEAAAALKEILASGTAEEALEKLVEAWMAHEMSGEQQASSRLSPKASKRLAALEERVAALEGRGVASTSTKTPVV